jgi:hypothetical protein
MMMTTYNNMIVIRVRSEESQQQEPHQLNLQTQ